MYPGLPEESRAGFPRGGQANAAYLFQKSPVRNDAGLIDPSFTAELANPVDSGYGSAVGNKRNPVISPKPVPTRGMHTRNQATSRAGTVSRSKGASPGKTRVLHL